MPLSAPVKFTLTTSKAYETLRLYPCHDAALQLASAQARTGSSLVAHAQPGVQHAGANAVKLVLGRYFDQRVAFLLVGQPLDAVQGRGRGIESDDLLPVASAVGLQRAVVSGQSAGADAEFCEHRVGHSQF
jgi:hypothetical protein